MAEHADVSDQASSARTQQGRSQATRAAVVAAARAVFAERGFEGSSVEQIARRAGVSKGAFYHHYRDKTEVLAAAYEDLERELTDQMLMLASEHPDPVDALRAGCQGFIAACTDPAVLRLALVDAPAGLGWARWREIDGRHGFGLLRLGLQAAADSGRARMNLIDIRAHLLLAALMEGALLIAAASDPKTVSRDVASLIDEQISALTCAQETP